MSKRLVNGERLQMDQGLSSEQREKLDSCNHEWVVFSFAVIDGYLLVKCEKCGCFGTVDDPSNTEWKKAFSASSNPYSWKNKKRVTVRGMSEMEHFIKSPVQEK